MYLTATFIVVFLWYTAIVKFSSSRKPLGLSHSCSTEGRTLDLKYLLVVLVHANALNRSTKTVTLTTNYTFDVAVYYFCTNCDIWLKLRLKWNPVLPSVQPLWNAFVFHDKRSSSLNATPQLSFTVMKNISRLHHSLEWNILVTLVHSYIPLQTMV